mmetsp:Transcript_34028/g.84133  ORF Transcript_34028/g.84133 Transcript_34028/m.84133 type:complete len:92 (-) Transcript_34028:192-467(-)
MVDSCVSVCLLCTYECDVPSDSDCWFNLIHCLFLPHHQSVSVSQLTQTVSRETDSHFSDALNTLRFELLRFTPALTDGQTSDITLLAQKCS